MIKQIIYTDVIKNSFGAQRERSWDAKKIFKFGKTGKVLGAAAAKSPIKYG